MREILFRGYDSVGGKGWVYGDLVHNQKVTVDGLEPRVMVGGYEVGAESVGQFTGLLDRNNRRIFDGDIIECVSWNEFFSVNGKPLERMRRRLLVAFRHGAFVCIERQQAPFDDKVWDMITSHDCVVVGNVKENPELFEKKRAF